MHSIIVTVGPKSIGENILRDLLKAGAERFRINLSHTDFSQLKKYYSILKSLNINPSIDTQGAQLRISKLSKNLHFNIGDKVKLYFKIKNKNDLDQKLIMQKHMSK